MRLQSVSISRCLLMLALLLIVLPLSGQQEPEQPYFSLSSDRTYGPGEKATIDVFAHNIDTLEFRLYRVNDPFAFFRKLEDLHQFGGRAPRLPRTTSWLERFHSWKVGWRNAVRELFRLQYSDESRARIREWLLERQREKAPAPGKTEFAQVPVLNPQQLVSTWKQRIPAQEYRWQSATIPVEVPGKGLFLVEAVHQGLRAYTILNVTELGLISKVSPGHILVFAQNRITGVPVTKLPVIALLKRTELPPLETDAQGLAETAVKEEKPEDVVLLARSGDDFAVAGISTWQLSSDPERFFTGYIYTDRPVYRPGHTVHYKGIARTNLGASYSVPEARAVQVEIRDAEYNTVLTKKLVLSANGTFDGDFELPVSAALGYYYLTLRSGEAEEHGGFHVEEYKKPEYEVKVTADPRRVIQGEPIRASIEARYYFGEPVASAKVVWVVHTSRYWAYFSDEEEAEADESGDYYAGEQIEEQSGQLDANGRLNIAVPTKLNEKGYDLRYRIEARVTDAANREIAGRGFAIATYGSFFVNLRTERYVVAAGESAGFLAEARDYDGKRIATSARVELRRWTWTQKGRTESEVLASSTVTTSTSDAVKVALPVPEAGSYEACMTAVTPENRQVKDCSYVWVSGKSESWMGRERRSVEIVPDKKSYRPGEVAKVLIVTGAASTHLLVTTEGKMLHTRQVLNAAQPNVTLEVPILREYAPNFYLNVAFLHENQLYQGSKSIKVPPKEHTMSVEVQPSKKEYKPGEPAVFNVLAKDHEGKPVPSAEFSLGVVDEAIYAIRPEDTQDIVSCFYGNQYNRVGTDSSLSYEFSGEAGKRAMLLASAGFAPPMAASVSRERLAQIKPEKLVEPKIRKAFPDTAYWVADLMTDSAGRATARFAFPDALTQWRATSRGVTRDTKVGSAIERVTVRKNLMLRLAVPRFFTEGDEVTLSVLVHNYLTSEKKTRVSLDVQGLEVLDGATRDISVSSRGDAKVDWRVRALPGREVKLLGKALTDEESDAMEISLPVVPFGVKMSLARAGSTDQPSGEVDTDITFPQQIAPHSRAMEISVSPSLAGALFGALEFLTTFPYGCTEQTMSSFLPNVVVAKALKDLGVKSDVDEAELKKKIREGLERLYDFQHQDGGWGWWKTDESHAFMTAYVIAGLAQAKEAGYSIREYDMQRAAKWLTNSFHAEKRALPDLRAYLAYSLTLTAKVQEKTPDTAVLNDVWAQRGDMTPYGRALLGLAFDAAGFPKQAAEIAEQLEREAQAGEGEAFWKVDRDTLMDFYGDASPEATAYAIKLLARHRPQSALLPKAAVWLMRQRNQGYYWYSTKQTAMVIYGLTDYLKASGELKPDFSVAVSVNGKQVLTKRFTSEDALAPRAPTIRLAAQDLASGANKIRITKSGAGRLYWSAFGQYFSTEEKLTRVGSVQLNLLREYFRLVPERTGEKITYRLEPFSGTAAPGDVLAVRLTVSGGEWRYLMIEDPIPAGAEFIERDDLYELKEKPGWWTFWYSRREFHDDRAAFFQTYFNRGQQQYLYLLKVVNPGKFRASPARVQPMYQPQFFATTESRSVEVR